MIPDDKNLLPLLGLEALPDEEARETLAQLSDTLMQAVLFRAVPMMTPGEQEEFSQMLEQDRDGDAVFSFLKDRVPSIEQIVEEEIRRLRDVLSRGMPPLTEEEKAFGVGDM